MKNKTELVLAGIILLAFFLPWELSYGSAFDYVIDRGAIRTWPLLVSPIAAIIAIITILKNSDLGTILASIFAGTVSATWFFLTFATAGKKMFTGMEYGFFVTVGAGTVLLIIGIYKSMEGE